MVLREVSSTNRSPEAATVIDVPVGGLVVDMSQSNANDGAFASSSKNHK